MDLCITNEKIKQMKELTYNERIAVMRILHDIILADNRIDEREQMLFTDIAKTLDLDASARQSVEKLNSLLALAIIHDFNQKQKEEFAKLMGQMIIVDKDINYNEVKLYNAFCESCNIEKDFNTEDYPEYTLSGPFVNPEDLMDIM
mgnify:CR=1 FL=1